ncbi:MAG: carboxymuconolactone decarboxylase family protein [Phenylobacterium sp.]|nr:carboxymuconolactone decarboxylase family protein [Phenylobacterium sp.]
MRLETPRIPPLADADLVPEQAAILATLGSPASGFNIFRTLARTPRALAAFLAWGMYVMSDESSLTPRQREIVILRVGYLCRSGYEFAQHVQIGLASGLSAEDIGRIKQGPEAGWTSLDGALIAMCDDLVAGHFVTDTTWSRLRAELSEIACMDAVYTAGQYTQVSMFLNTFGVQLDAGLKHDSDLTA